MISGIVVMLALIIMKGPWDSFEELNKVDNAASMHKHFAFLFMFLAVFWKFLLPKWEYVLLTPKSIDWKSEESNPRLVSKLGDAEDEAVLYLFSCIIVCILILVVTVYSIVLPNIPVRVGCY